MKAILNFDGRCAPNPGAMTCAYVLKDESGAEIKSEGIILGDGTCNIAEYLGLINGLSAAVKIGIDELIIRGDSQIVIYRMINQYHGKPKEHLKPLIEQSRILASKMKCQWEWLRREKNEEADALTKACVIGE